VKILAVMFVLAAAARAETTLVIEAAPSDEGLVPVGLVEAVAAEAGGDPTEAAD